MAKAKLLLCMKKSKRCNCSTFVRDLWISTRLSPNGNNIKHEQHTSQLLHTFYFGTPIRRKLMRCFHIYVVYVYTNFCYVCIRVLSVVSWFWTIEKVDEFIFREIFSKFQFSALTIISSSWASFRYTQNRNLVAQRCAVAMLYFTT